MMGQDNSKLSKRHGALGVSQEAGVYRPWQTGTLPGLGSLEQMAEVVRKVLANEAVTGGDSFFRGRPGRNSCTRRGNRPPCLDSR